MQINNKKLITIFAIVFVDLLGFSILIPLIPFYAKEFQASDTVIGLLVASYAAAQLVGAPLLGRLSDKYGRRPVLLISILGTIAGFIMLIFANSLELLFLSRIVDGLTGGNISVAQAYITDITDEKNRAKGLGLIGAAFGLGFIVGPALGGLLSTIGANFSGFLAWEYALPALAATVLASFNWLAVYFWLPESLTKEQMAEAAANPQKNAFSWHALQVAFARPLVGPLLKTRFFFSLAFAMFQTVFALYALDRFGFGAAETAYVLTYVGIIIAVVQGGLIGRLTARFDEGNLLFVSVIMMSGSLLIWAVAPTIWVLLLIMIPLAFSGGVFNTVINSQLTKSVTPQEIGGTLGLSAALESGTRVLAPTMGGLLLDTMGSWSPGIVSGLLVAVLIPYVWREIANKPEPALAVPEQQTFNGGD
jgi:DHA1 family tetracycline resistance protein-like MFS transporter